MTDLARKYYVEASEKLLEEVGKLYHFLVHEDTPESCNWTHVGDLDRALIDIRNINSYYIKEI